MVKRNSLVSCRVYASWVQIPLSAPFSVRATYTHMAQRTVQLSKTKLIEKLIANRAKHIETFVEATEEWGKDVEAAVVALKADPFNDDVFNVFYKKRAAKPVSYEDQYDTAIAQMDMEIREVLELDLTEFQQLVCDDWNWSANFASNVYTSPILSKKGK